MTGAWLVLAAWAQTPCAAPTHGSVLEAVADAEKAFQEALPEAIQEAASRARAQLPCVGARLLPSEAAAVHRLFAYDAFVRRDQDHAKLWLESSRAADPDTTLPEAVLPARHPLRRLFDEAMPRALPGEPFTAPKGEVWVDGKRSDAVPVGRPVILQVTSITAVETQLLPEGGAPEGAEPEAPSAPSTTSLSVGAVGTWVASPDAAQTYGGPQVRTHLPLVGALHGEGVVGLPLAAQAEGEQDAVYALPTAQLGLVGRGAGRVTPWAGAGVLLLFDAADPRVGGAAAVGLDVPVGRVAIAPEMRVGWASVPVVSVGVGVSSAGAQPRL